VAAAAAPRAAAAAAVVPAVAPPAPAVPSHIVLDGAPAPDAALRERLLPYLNVRSAELQDWSADGRSIYVTTRFGNTAQLHRVDAAMGARRQLTFFDEPVRRVRVSRSRDRPFLVLSKDQGGGEDFQLYRMDLPGGRTTLLTDGRSRHASFELARDGRTLAFTCNARNGRDMDVYVMDPRDPSARRLLCQVEGDYQVLDFSRDGRRLLLKEFVSINRTHLHEADLATGRTVRRTPAAAKPLRAPAGPASAVATTVTPATTAAVAYLDGRYAHDGRAVFATTDRHGEFRELVRLVGPEADAQVRLTSRIPWSVDAFDVSPAGDTVALSVNEGGISALRLMNGRTGAPLPAPRVPRGVIGSIRFDPSGRRVAFSLSSARGPGDVYVLTPGQAAPVRWTASEIGGLDASAFVEPELTRYPTFDDAGGGGSSPRMIPVFYFRPRPLLDAREHGRSGKLPVVITIHGGPESQWRPWFSPGIACWVQELGVAVLAPNVRGSDGYGKSYLLLDNGRKREDSVRDIGALLDWIRTRPELDAERVAVHGGSYGGYMVLSSLHHYPDRIRAGIDFVGISSFVSFLTNTRDYRRDLRRAEYGDERDPAMRSFLESISPLAHAQEIRSPLLCVQGANDPRVPASEAEQIVRALRSGGRDAWYVLARNEGHGFTKRDNQDLASLIVFRFLEKHLLGPRQ
jgi:dipeptidyl aminopeptidase/acylaminoacyl peptidase